MWRTEFEKKHGPIKVGDIVTFDSRDHREVEVIEATEYSVLVKPTDGKTFYVSNDGVKIKQAWWGYERIVP